MTKAIIASPIDEETVRHLTGSLELEPVDNLHLPPHLTWFTLDIPEKDKEALVRRVKEFSEESFPLEVKINGITTTDYQVARLSIEKDEGIQRLHEEIVLEAIKFRDPSLPSKVKEFYDRLSDEERKLVDQYGRPNVMQRFQPHISLGKTRSLVKKEFHTTVVLEEVDVYSIE